MGINLLMKFIVVAFQHHAELLTGDGTAKHQIAVCAAFHQLIIDRPGNSVLCPGSRGVIEFLLIHLCFYRLSEGIHRVARAKLRPKMLRVTVVGCDAFRAAFLVGTDVLQRIKAELFAEHGEEFHGGIVCAFCRRSCRSEVTASEACPGSIFDAGRLTHLYTDMRVVGTAAAVPPAMIPRKRLIHGAVIRIDETVNAGIRVGRLIPVLDENRSTRLGASDRVQHKTFDRYLSPRCVARVLCHD